VSDTGRRVIVGLALLSALRCGAVYAADNGRALTPPMGWTTWSSLQTNIDEDTIKAIARVQAATLKASGYIYVNVDGGWYLNPDAEVDAFGRWVADRARFPSGMAALGDDIHSLGLKFGLYVTPGIPAIAVYLNRPIEATPYRAPDIAITSRTEQTYLGGTMYYIDYSAPGSQEFVNSWANLFASWGVDYLKLDGVGDWNIPDIQAWSTALRQTGRPIHLALSNDLNPALADTWTRYANGWRISPDIEAYNGVSLTTWPLVATRFALAPLWLASGRTGGWNDLDSLLAGGMNTGLTTDERQTMTTLWTLSASPLIVGDDLRTLDPFGTSLLSNPEVIAVNQQGVVAAPLTTGTPQQAWTARQADGSVVVGLFNLGESDAPVGALWSSLGFTGRAAVRDLWARADLGLFDGVFNTVLRPHASMLLRVTPAAVSQRRLASTGTLTGWAFLGSSGVSPEGQRAQYIGFGSTLTFENVPVSGSGWYAVTVNYINGDAQRREAVMAVNGNAWRLSFPAGGDWSANTTTQGITSLALFTAGVNTVTFSNPAGWAPDIVSITVQPPVAIGLTLSRIFNVQTGRVLEDPIGSMALGTPVIQWPTSDGLNQLWQLMPAGSGTVTLMNALSGQALDAYAHTAEPGAPLVQWPASGDAIQRWRPVAAGRGSFVLINQANSLLVHASSEWDGAKVDQWIPTGTPDEQWMLVPVM
jgi:alpha-galactosidase